MNWNNPRKWKTLEAATAFAEGLGEEADVLEAKGHYVVTPRYESLMWHLQGYKYVACYRLKMTLL